jgi:hypothetical protein
MNYSCKDHAEVQDNNFELRINFVHIDARSNSILQAAWPFVLFAYISFAHDALCAIGHSQVFIEPEKGLNQRYLSYTDKIRNYGLCPFKTV